MRPVQRDDRPLEQVPGVIAAADVGQFVEQDRVGVPGQVEGRRGGRQDHDRTPPADDDRHAHPGGPGQTDSSPYPEPDPPALERRAPRRVVDSDRPAPEAGHREQATTQPDQQDGRNKGVCGQGDRRRPRPPRESRFARPDRVASEEPTPRRPFRSFPVDRRLSRRPAPDAFDLGALRRWRRGPATPGGPGRSTAGGGATGG